MAVRQLTTAAHGHVLTNVGVWSHDARWIVYDTRSTADGGVFDGGRIERVDVATGRVEIVHESRRGACCGVVTASPVDDRVVFIRGPEQPDADWQYGPARREGWIVHVSRCGTTAEPEASILDARDLTPPFTPGALRGGSHVHVFSGDGRLVSFTYEDAHLERLAADGTACERSLRAIGVSLVGRPVAARGDHPRNHDGTGFSVLVTRLNDVPRPGSDEIDRAFEEGWVGRHGYLRPDASRQRYALAFQGMVVGEDGRRFPEVFVIDLPEPPEGLMHAGEGKLEGTLTTRPQPPRGVRQRRLTFTADRRWPGVRGPRHWLRSSHDGSRIAFLLADDDGTPQLHTVSPNGGPPRQVTDMPSGVASAFTWSPDDRRIAFVSDGSVMTVDVKDGTTTRLTDRVAGDGAPRPEACVYSPDGTRIAFVRRVAAPDGTLHNQIFVADAAAESVEDR
jgi:hypothetical protein